MVHLAALLCEPGNWDDIGYFDNNNSITKNMIDVMNHLDAECFINFSTLGVYPNRSATFDEESIIDMADNTECLYGLAKFNSEILFTYYLKNRTKLINLRLTQVYGPGMQEDRLIGMMKKELKDKNTITVFGDGQRVSNFVHVDDVVHGVKLIIKDPIPGTYIFGDQVNYTYRKIAENLLEKYGNAESTIVSMEKGLRCVCKYDTGKFRRTYGFLGKGLRP